MPTIFTHAITAIPVSLGLKKDTSTKRILILSIIFSLLPDLDGIGYKLGVEYDSLFGHRGFSHSLFFIVLAALVFVFLAAPKIKINSQKFLLLFLNFFTIGSLHILLDSMTNGGLGVALLSPFSNERFFFPWRPIEVSAILPEYFFELNGLAVLRFEFLFIVIPSIVLTTLIIIIKKKCPKTAFKK